MPQTDFVRSPITAAAKKKHLAEIAQLIADAAEIQNLKGCISAGTGDVAPMTESREQVKARFTAVEEEAIDKTSRFAEKARRLLRVFDRELPDAALACANVEMVQLFTENDAEGERLLGRFWITDVWDREPGDSIDRRCGIDLQAIRDVTAWLDVLVAKLELNSGGSRIHKNDSATLALIADAIRPFKGIDVSCEEICKRLDEKHIPRPPGARWREFAWWSAWKNRKYRRIVESRVNKFKNA